MRKSPARRMRLGLTVLEALIAASVLALFLALAFSALRASGLQVASSTIENRLEQATLRVVGALRDDLRRASLASVALKDPDPVFGARGIEFRKIIAIDQDSGAPVSAPGLTAYSLDGQGGFVRSEGGVAAAIAGYAPDAGDGSGPGLSFQQAPGGVIRFTVRLKGVDAGTGAVVTRSRSGSVKVLNP